MASHPIIPAAPSSFSQARKGLPRKVNDRSQGRFPITSITAGCWAYDEQSDAYLPVQIGGVPAAGQGAPDGQMNVLYCHLLTSDRPVDIESRYAIDTVVSSTQFQVKGNVCGQPSGLVGERWGDADLWPALTPPQSYGEPGLLDIPTPPGEEQRRIQGYPIVLTPGVLPVAVVNEVVEFATGTPHVVVTTESSVNHGVSGKRILAHRDAPLSAEGSCIIAREAYTPELQEAGFIEFVVPQGGAFRLFIVGLYDARLYSEDGAGIPVELLFALNAEQSLS